MADELESRGYSSEDAQAKALELMGAPEKLNPSFRESWVRRASNWKYCLDGFLKAALHAVLVNALARFTLMMPILLVTSMEMFENGNKNSPAPIILFALANFGPGLWFCARELSERFAIHPHRKRLLLYGFLMAWFLEMLPFLPMASVSSGRILSALHFLNGVVSLPLVLGQIPLLILAWESSYSAKFALCVYNLSICVLCILFARFYRPKSGKPFLLSDKT